MTKTRLMRVPVKFYERIKNASQGINNDLSRIYGKKNGVTMTRVMEIADVNINLNVNDLPRLIKKRGRQ